VVFSSEIKTLKATVRFATPADIPAMIALERDANMAAHWPHAQYERIFVQQEPKPASPERAQRIAMVICDDLGLQGFLVARQIDAELEIENVAVASSARRRGLGTDLVGKLLLLARRQGAKALFLEVRESNQAARALYEKCGFIQDGNRKRYYEHPTEAAILYRLDLA
jgi:ribosomal-protein-alanine N-acetyltransferase